MSGDLTGWNMTSTPRLCLVRLGQVRLSYLTGLILVLNLTSPLSADLVEIGRVTLRYITGRNMTSPPRSG